MASNAQASERGMASTGATGFEVMMTGAGTAALGVIKSGCVFVMLMAGAGAAGRGKMLMRAVSFFGSAMRATMKIAQSSARCHLLIWILAESARSLRPRNRLPVLHERRSAASLFENGLSSTFSMPVAPTHLRQQIVATAAGDPA